MYHYMQSAEDTSKEISKVYHKASLVLSNEMDKIFERFVTKHKLSEADARKLLTSIKDKTSLEEIKAELRKGATGSDKRELLAELESPAYAYRLNRLEDKQQQIDNLMNTVYNQEKALSTDHYKELMGESYNRSMYEIQRQAGIGYSFDKLDSRTIDNMLKSKWSGANYSSRIWNNTQKLADSLKTELIVALLTGEREADISKNLMFQFASGANNARRLVRTESCHIANEMDMKAYKESGIDTYVFVATLDLKTSAICASLDGKRFKVKDQQPGVNAPPMHPWCRSTTVPYFDDEWGRSGERAARDADGKTYYVPADITYPEWKEQYVDSPIVVDQTQKITKKKDFNDYSVDRQLVNSKKFHDKFESLTYHKSTNESVYQETMKMLEHRDGTDLEDIVILDARTGNVIVKNTLSVRSGQTGLTHEQYEIYQQASGKKVLLHNHPNGGRLSFTDLKTLFVNDEVEASIAVGHNGIVHIVSNPNRKIDIEKLYESLYNEYKEIYANSELARIYALDDLYDLKIFDYESR